MFLNQKNKKFPSSSGHHAFTLLEMVIAIGIFTIATLILLQIFLTATKTQQKSNAVLKAQAEARYALEVISRQIRSGYIDYSHYGISLPDADSNGISDPQTELALIDLSNNSLVFSHSNVDCPAGSINCVKMDFAGTIQDLTGKGLEVQNLDFYISPTSDPFVLDFNPATGNQPKVTIVMTIQTVGTRPEQIATTYLQTTVSSRYYKR